jgi:hypothetical protein
MIPAQKQALAHAIRDHLITLLPTGRQPRHGGLAWHTVNALAAALASADEQALHMAIERLASTARQRGILDLLGAARSIRRHPGEPTGAFRARIVGAYELWSKAGTLGGVKRALEVAGYKVSILEHYTENPDIWAEFSITLEPAQTEFTTDTWNDGQGAWDDGSAWGWTLGQLEPQRILHVVNEMKAAHSKPRNIYYELGDPVDYWDDANGVWDDGSRWYGFDTVVILGAL